MITLPIGLITLMAIIYFALAQITLETLMNPEALILVAAGSVGVLVLSAPSRQLGNLFKIVFGAFAPEISERDIEKNLLSLAKNKTKNVGKSHPLISYAQELWETGVEPDLFMILLEHRLEDVKRGTEGAVATLRNLAKFPPALGMTGTVIGLVSLFSHLTPDSKATLGPSLALAMTSTLYGLVVANVVLLPLADRLSVMHMEKSKIADKVYGTLLLIHGGEPQSVIEVELQTRAA